MPSSLPHGYHLDARLNARFLVELRDTLALALALAFAFARRWRASVYLSEDAAFVSPRPRFHKDNSCNESA
jgi:hypothetical protein